MVRPVRVALLEKSGGVLSWHQDLSNALGAQGATVVPLQIRPAQLAEYREKWRTKVHPLANTALVTRVAADLRAHQPDLVLLLNQPGLPPETIETWRSALPPGVPFVGWLCDHLEALPAHIAPNLDGVYYFDSATRPRLESAYSVPSARPGARFTHLPLAVDPARYAGTPIPFEQRHRRLVFAGKNTFTRRQLIAGYRVLGGRIDTFGPKARNFFRPWRSRRLAPAALARLYTRYFAALNLLQPPNTVHGLNLRAYEIPAAGGLSTYPLTPDLPSAFVPGEEVVAYRDLADLKNQIDALLSAPARAAAIAEAGRARVLREHTFAHRAARILRDWMP